MKKIKSIILSLNSLSLISAPAAISACNVEKNNEEQEINKQLDNTEIKANLSVSDIAKIDASDINDSQINVSGIDTNLFEVNIEKTPNDNDGSLDVVVKIKSKKFKNIHKEFRKSFRGFGRIRKTIKDKLNATTTNTSVNLVPEIDPANTLPSKINPSQVIISNLDTKLFTYTVDKLYPNDKAGTLGIKYTIKSKKFEKINSERALVLEGFKIKEESQPINSDPKVIENPIMAVYNNDSEISLLDLLKEWNEGKKEAKYSFEYDSKDGLVKLITYDENDKEYITPYFAVDTSKYSIKQKPRGRKNDFALEGTFKLDEGTLAFSFYEKNIKKMVNVVFDLNENKLISQELTEVTNQNPSQGGKDDNGEKPKNPDFTPIENVDVKPVETKKGEFIVKSEDKTVYVRPPFGAQFNLKDTDINFTTVFDHLDSPGAKGAEKSVKKGTLDGLQKTAGSQELSEFLALKNVMEEYEDLSKPNSYLIFGGDTNIYAENFYLQKQFENDLKPTIGSLGEDKSYYTSISVQNGYYVNPYDKMFFKNKADNKLETLTTANTPELQFKLDILRAFNDNIIPEEYKDLSSYGSNLKVPLTRISDHAPVFTDIKLKDKNLESNVSVNIYPKAENTIRIAHWNILNFGKADVENTRVDSEFKWLSIAKIIEAGGFDIIGLTEINYGASDSVKLIVNELNRKQGANFKMIVQDPSEASWVGTDWGRFESQQEQIVIIYDANLFNPIEFNNKKIGHSYRNEIPSIMKLGPVKQKGNN
ncbi:lipoprotein 17-related variable surface protein [Mycoplasma sp. VS31B]